VLNVDFSGNSVQERWYFECKRYTSTLSWPTVFEKISYATNARADFLLFITTSGFSPTCVDELNRWNARGDKPLVRQWPGHEIVTMLHAHPKVKFKYSLEEVTGLTAPIAMLDLALEVSKASQAIYSAYHFDQDVGMYIEVAACLSYLLTTRVADFETYAHLVFSPFRNLQDGFPWLQISSSVDLPVDRFAGRALLTTLRLCCRASNLSVEAMPDGVRITAPGRKLQIPDTAHPLVNEVGLWGDMEVSEGEGAILVRQRRING
jgi:Restriction endonuclease